MWKGRSLPQSEIYRERYSCVLFKNTLLKSVCAVFLQDDPVGNINLAMEIAEKHLDIPKMLDAEGEMTVLPAGSDEVCGCVAVAMHGD